MSTIQIVLAIIGVLIALGIGYALFARKPTDQDKPTELQPSKTGAAPPAAGKGAAKGSSGAASLPAKKAGAAEPTQRKSERPKAPPAQEAAFEEDVPVESGDEERARSGGAQAPLARRKKDVAGLRKGLAKARESEGFFGRLKAIFGGKPEIDPALLEQIEEVLLTSDVGVQTTESLMNAVRDSLSKGELKDESKIWSTLRGKALELCDRGEGGLVFSDTPTVVLVVGVNGSGKTTTIGKLATRLTAQGKKVVLAAGDTFRAAAVQQLVVWGKRAGCEVVTGADGSNSGAVIFDAIQKAKELGADVVLADTAGRLHTKSNLMDELKKITKTLGKAQAGAPHQTLLVLDATNGQNASQQAAMFKEAIPLTGLVLTKLDGTAKGGVVLGICAEHELPVRYIGIGESPEDLRDFDAEEFVEALLGGASESAERAA